MKKQNKKIIAMIVICLCVLLLAAALISCGQKNKPAKADDAQKSSESVKEEKESEPEDVVTTVVKESEPLEDEKEQPQESNDQTETKPEEPKEQHEHVWEKQTKTIHHKEEGHYEKVLVKEAWTEQVPVYETVAINVCNLCRKDIVDETPDEHVERHALNGEGIGGHHIRYDKVQTGTKPVKHPAEYERRWIVDQKAWTETKTIYVCKCGAEKE